MDRVAHDDGDAAEQKPASAYGLYLGWGAALLLAVILAVVAVWQVNERVYTPEAAAEHYWEALNQGAGREALGFLSSAPEFDQVTVDHVLLDGDALQRSAELVEGAQIGGDEDMAEVSFIVGSENYRTPLPTVLAGTTWGFFDDWRVAPSAITWFEVEVPGAPQGGIGQVQVNGAPVNLDEETARLSAFVPSAVELSVDSQWLVGSAEHVVVHPPQDQDSAERVTLDLEASEAAVELLHTEIQEFFDGCSEEQVLMPAGCPVGVTTNHQVNASTIDWQFPDPEDVTLSFDAEGWQISYESLIAEVSYEARHYHTGEQLTETEQVPFDLDVRVGASGEDLIITVAGRDAAPAEPAGW